jgi:hypothetical protein
MKKGKGPLSKGPGFADAIFSIKDMQTDYASFNQESSPITVPHVAPYVPQKNPLASKPKPKVDLQSKPTVSSKSKTLEQPSDFPKEKFKINAGK